MAGRQHDLGLFEVFAGVAHVHAAFGAVRETDMFAIDLHALLHDHGVCALRHHGTGHDAYALTFADFSCISVAGKGGADDLQAGFPGAVEIVGVEGITVHCRVIVIGNIARRKNIFGQNPAQRIANGQQLPGGDRFEELAYVFARLRDRHRIGVVIVKTAWVVDEIGKGFFTHGHYSSKGFGVGFQAIAG